MDCVMMEHGEYILIVKNLIMIMVIAMMMVAAENVVMVSVVMEKI